MSYALQPDLVDGNHRLGFALSIEGGRKIDMNNNAALSLTPQAQWIYSHVDFYSFTDPFDVGVSQHKGESLLGRLGSALNNEQD